MLGEYQPRNAANVLSAIEILSSTLPVSEEAIREGLENAKWPARFEIIGREPLIIFDGAHNAEGISAAVKSAKEYFANESAIVVSGVLRDKDYHKIASDIAKISHRGFTITPDSPRALPAETYAKVLTDCGCHSTPCESVVDALNQAVFSAKEENKAILILGSLYTYAEVMDALEK
jgi:dihydrofolate synthase/folylpolyglutamate synthase